MASIDVRDKSDQEIDEIIFSDNDAKVLKHAGESVVDLHDSSDYVQIFGKEHAQNLIKALEKAIELGWLE